jgi:ubiquinol-cytochrome c reductase cytochrome c1 subunit
MTKSSLRIAFARRSLVAAAMLAAALSPLVASASEGGGMPSAQIDLTDKASLQRGAARYLNNCSGSHTLNNQRK